MKTSKACASWALRNLRRRVNRTRHCPDNTCPASRHLHVMADVLAAGKPYPMFDEEPEHCAATMLAVLESLWKLRTQHRVKPKVPEEAKGV